MLADLRGVILTTLSVVAAVAITRLTWPFFLHAPFAPLFIVVFAAARWTTEAASLLAIPAAAAGSLFLTPAGVTNAPPWWMSLTFVGVAVGVNRLVVGRNRVEAELRQLFQGNPQAMWVYRVDTKKFLAANSAALALYGYTLEEFLRLTVNDIAAREDPAHMRGARPGERHVTKLGRVLDVQVDSSTVQWGGHSARLELLHDLTEHRRLEEQLSQSQKMEAIGQLAGGVAHDFNNLLTTIQGYTDLLLAQIGPDKPIWADLHEIQASVSRAALLTHQLLAFSRRHEFDITTVDVNDVVSRLVHMMKRLIPEDIELAISLADGDVHALADVSRLEQVLINLVVNARDAIRGPGGRIGITTRRADPRGDRAAAGGQPFVVLEVVDNGVGMDEATRQRIFEPFFTTKRAGAGTGLGLATVYGIVQQCGGHIEVTAAPGAGSTFRVFLPWTGEHIDTPRANAEEPDGLVGSERILVVEDSPELRILATQVLKRYGYDVIEASTPEEAVAFTQRAGAPADLLLMDVVMPRMAGPEIVVHLKRAWPDAGVLYMSGYEPESLVRRGILLDEDDLLKKPFSPAELLARVRGILDRPVPEMS